MVKAFHNKVEIVRKRLIQKEIQITATRISIAGEEVFIETIPISHNLSSNLLETKTCMVRVNKYSEMLIKHYTEDQLFLDFEQANEKIGPKLLDLFSNEIIAFGEGFDRKYFIKINKKGEINYIDLISLKQISEQELNLPTEYSTYSGNGKCCGSSPSQKRKKSLVFYKTNKINLYNEIMDKVTYGAYSLVMNKKTNRSKATKADARLNQYLAPSSFNNYFINTVAFSMFKWKDAEGNDHKDGQAYTNAKFVCNMFNDFLGTEYFKKDRDTTGTLLQCRPWTCKVASEIVQRKYINTMIKFHKWEIEVISRDNITKEIQEEFNKCFHGDKSSKFYNKVLIIVDTKEQVVSFDLNKTNIDFFTDLNGLKIEFDLTRQSGYNLLDIAKDNLNCEDAAFSSTQIAQSIYYSDFKNNGNIDKATEFFNTLSTNFLNKYEENNFTKKESVPSLDSLNNLYVKGLLTSVAPEIIHKSKSMYRTVVNDFLNGSKRNISSFSFYLDGSFTRIIPDCGTSFDISLLNQGEVYLPAAEKYFSDMFMPEEEWYVSNFKYPKIHVQEFGYDKVISTDELLRRLENIKIEKEVKLLLTNLIKDLSTGIIMVPAIELNKKKHAGMDYDYDGMSSIFDISFNYFLSKLKPVVVDII